MSILGPSWKTTVVGFVAGVATYFDQLGPALPTTAREWGVACVSAALFALGLASKDANVTNASKPTVARPVDIPAAPTPAPPVT